MDSIIAIRSRTTAKLFRELDVDKATGHDKISAAILKRIGMFIADPFTKICRRLLYEACWPKIWKYHLIVPIYKKDVAFAAGNYRGVHLTPVLSKVAEKVIGANLITFLQRTAFGKSQWAFTPGLGSRDLVTKLVMECILSICSDKKIGAYLSDMSGAFDRVCKEYLLAKLQAVGVGSVYLNFLDAYLSPRQGQVVIEGEFSEMFEIANSVFQGTVLGPPLWNTYFADVSAPAASTGGSESKFADDLNVFQKFPKHTSTEMVTDKLEQCRRNVQRWGRLNRVAFDEKKEHMVIVHPVLAFGDPFNLLGLLVDPKLTMRNAVDKILSKIRPRIKALLRTRSHYSIASLIEQFKTHVWGLMESHSGGIAHAATSILDQLDNSQEHFLDELGVSVQTAFDSHNFAPPTLRRNIAILGLIHKRVLALSHPSFDELLPYFHQRFGFHLEGRHSKQLYNHCEEIVSQWRLWQRSIFGMVDKYNLLPQSAVDCPSVSTFQSLLTKMAKDRCQAGDSKWMYTYVQRLRSS